MKHTIILLTGIIVFVLFLSATESGKSRKTNL